MSPPNPRMDVDMPGHRYTGVMLDAEQENKQLGKHMFENSNPTKMNIGDVKMNRRSALACLGAIFGTSAYHERIFARQHGQPATSLTGLYGKKLPEIPACAGEMGGAEHGDLGNFRQGTRANAI